MWNARAWFVDFDQCAFGAPSKKPTRLVFSDQRMQGSFICALVITNTRS